MHNIFDLFNNKLIKNNHWLIIIIGRTAGITVRMITGDNIDTARAIAKDCGLI